MNKDEEIVCYILINKDLGMSIGKAVAQGGHAVQLMLETLDEFIDGNASDYDESPESYGADRDIVESANLFREWKDTWDFDGVTKIVLGADREQIKQIIKEVRKSYVASSVIDEGRTEIPPGSLTAACLQPMPRKIAKQFVGHLRLL